MGRTLKDTPSAAPDEATSSNRPELNRLKRRRILEDWAFISPQLFLFALLTLVPFIFAIPILFTDMSNFTDPSVNSVGWANFTAIFDNPSVAADYFPALRRTLIFVALNYTTVYIFGLSLALLMFEFGVRRGFFTIIYMPLMLSGLAVGYRSEEHTSELQSH